MPILAASANGGRWQAASGDPTVIGWSITIAYLVASLLCFQRAWQPDKSPAKPRVRNFWWGCAAAMLLLALNKQLDFHVLITQVGRDWSTAWGWYDHRRTVQALFFVFVAAFSAAGLLATYWYIEGAPHPCYIALAGLVATCAYILLRAAAMHHFQEYFGLHTPGPAKHEWLELFGIATVATAARWRNQPGHATAAELL